MLVVDDEPALREIFGKWLAGAGCNKVYTAENGEDALALLATVSVDVMVTDIRMPVMDGITLVRDLADKNKTIPSIIFISGFGDIDRKEMYGLGAEAFLNKPVTRADFISHLERAVAARATLWNQAMTMEPRQTFVIRANGTDGISGESPIHLGRGGFSARCDEPLSTGRVTFHCAFPLGDAPPERFPGEMQGPREMKGPREMQAPREMNGQGYVRWVSKAEHAVGIEFAYLDSDCRSWLLDEIAAAGSRSFIPA